MLRVLFDHSLVMYIRIIILFYIIIIPRSCSTIISTISGNNIIINYYNTIYNNIYQEPGTIDNRSFLGTTIVLLVW